MKLSKVENQDKIRLWNDGGLPKEVLLENLFKVHISKPCNPNLANVFFKCGMIESWGRGFEKIANYCAEENAKLPEIDLSLGGVTARCFASDFYLGLNEGLNLSEKEKIVYELIKKYKQVTSKFIIETTSFSHATVERAIKKLFEELKCIKRNGSKKTGYWEIIMEDK
jgi:ATP-dependent DNA helicase RecG